jgi:hypothetical protein
MLVGRTAEPSPCLRTSAPTASPLRRRHIAGDLILAGGEAFPRPIDPKIPLTYSVAPCGSGKVVLVSDATWLSDAQLDGTFTEPNELQRKLYDLEFRLFTETLR